MRPRFMNRGSENTLLLHQMGVRASMRPRFMNRGSRGNDGRSRPDAGRFNEAPIHESGKWRTGPDAGAERRASMRPRFMNRGSGGSCYRGRDSTGGFNEAPIHESGKSCTIMNSLMYHNASMRPRFMNRGSVVRLVLVFALYCLLQ